MKESNLPFSLIPYLFNLTELNKLNAQQIISIRFLGIPVHKSHFYILIQKYMCNVHLNGTHQKYLNHTQTEMTKSPCWSVTILVLY